MKYRIQEHYKQTDKIQNTGALQTNRWNTEYRSTTNKSVCLYCSCIRYFICLIVVFLFSVFHLFVCSAPVFCISSVCLYCSCIRYFNKQTDEIPNTGALQTNKRNTEYRSTTNKQMKYRFVVLLYSVCYLFVCSVPVFGISSVWL
jgi:Ca2+-dependent lipid-binding protein